MLCVVKTSLMTEVEKDPIYECANVLFFRGGTRILKNVNCLQVLDFFAKYCKNTHDDRRSKDWGRRREGEVHCTAVVDYAFLTEDLYARWRLSPLTSILSFPFSVSRSPYFSRSQLHSFTHSLTHSRTCAFVNSCTYTHALTPPRIHALPHIFTHSP